MAFTANEKKIHVSNLKEALEESNLPFRMDLFSWHVVLQDSHEMIQKEHVVLVGERNK